MKYFSLRPIVALSTFIIGISVVAFWYFNSRNNQTVSIPESLPQMQKETNVNMSAWQILLSFENQDLKVLQEQKKKILQNAIDEFVGKTTDFAFPRLLSQISNAKNEKFYILIEELPLLAIPGNCGLRIYLFDLNGKQLKKLSFDSGWRIFLTDSKYSIFK
ncbi:MAG: hypothetical protein M3367_10790 [Acidobacteriota bacterium]|nr:hypothetical protein [Acidobacteriota bacterium]